MVEMINHFTPSQPVVLVKTISENYGVQRFIVAEKVFEQALVRLCDCDRQEPANLAKTFDGMIPDDCFR
jgi:hypothetical protein